MLTGSLRRKRKRISKIKPAANKLTAGYLDLIIRKIYYLKVFI